MTDRISLREWQQNFLSGKYESCSRSVQIEAGWFDWFCRDSSLVNKTKKLGKILLKIQDDFILDNFRISFKNVCPVTFPLYDRIMFIDLNEERNLFFGIDVDSGFIKEKHHCKYNLWVDTKNCFKDFYFFDQKSLIKALPTLIKIQEMKEKIK